MHTNSPALCLLGFYPTLCCQRSSQNIVAVAVRHVFVHCLSARGAGRKWFGQMDTSPSRLSELALLGTGGGRVAMEVWARLAGFLWKAPSVTGGGDSGDAGEGLRQGG